MVAAVALVGAGAVSAAAVAACTPTPTSKAFAALGDQADYSLAPNSAFEAGTAGWWLTRASVANGNETPKMQGAADGRSLALQSTDTEVAPALCVDIGPSASSPGAPAACGAS